MVLVDRCLGHQLPLALKRYGVNAFHLGDLYGDDGQQVDDVRWLEDAGREGYIVLTKDSRVRHNSMEWEALQAYGAKVFILTARNATAALTSLIYGRQLPNILRRGKRPGPCCWRIQGNDIRRLIP